MIESSEQHHRPARTGAYLSARRPAAPPVTVASAASPMDHMKLSMRRFREFFAALPFQTRATCPTCGQVVPATFEQTPGGVAVNFACPPCGRPRQFHHDVLYTPARLDRSDSPSHTHAGVPIRPVLRGLPRTVETLCPGCRAIIVGRYFVKSGSVWIEKTCPEHGYFRDCVNRDAALYAKGMYWTFREAPGHERPHVAGGSDCPSDCGLCRRHQSSACLANIDLTNRCNLHCPICFANSGRAGYVYEPDFEQVVAMLQQLRDLRPTPATAVQFSGGEPTLHPDFHRIVATAREMGFSNIQIATNGITHAKADFARSSAAAGLHTLYLQFDGVGEEPHRRTRAAPWLWAKKLACIENCRRTGLKVCLVPTIARGVNDDEVGRIVRFALDNIDVVSGVSFQPVSFSGRIDPGELAARRYTLGDLAHDMAPAAGAEVLRDMFPLSIVAPLARLLAALTGDSKITPNCHPDCAFGTYLLVDGKGQPHPFPKVIDVEGMFSGMDRIAARIERRGRPTWRDRLAIYRMIKRNFHADAAPEGLTVKRFIRSLQGLVDKGVGRGPGERHTYKTLLCAGMHFQDCYNYDTERVRRCVILYSTPEGVFPFCTYNCGPEYRRFIEPAHGSRPARAPAEAAVTCGRTGMENRSS